MKLLMAISAAAAVAFAQGALAQNQPSNPPTASQPSTPPGQSQTAAQQIQQDLSKAGFHDVKVVAESFVVQAKTKNGDPVVMTIGPRGMSVFEAMTGSGPSSRSGTTGSTGPSGGASSK
jgi:hypothetical protein